MILIALSAALLSLHPADGRQDVAQEPEIAPNCDGAHLEVVACYGDRRRQVEAEQQTILARINGALDVLNTDYGAKPAEAKQRLAEAQDAWIDFAGADCRVGEALFGDGNAFALDALDCEIAHYEERNRQLIALEDRYLTD